MKTDKEILMSFEAGSYEMLSTAELQRLKAILELRSFEKPESDIGDVGIPDIAKETVNAQKHS